MSTIRKALSIIGVFVALSITSTILAPAAAVTTASESSHSRTYSSVEDRVSVLERATRTAERVAEAERLAAIKKSKAEAARKARAAAKKRAATAERPVAKKTTKPTTPRPKPSAGNPFSGWKATYWNKAQSWAQQAKTRAVVKCESGNRVTAVNSTGKYRGLYQMDKNMWSSYGGLELAARPDQASRAAQNYVAYRAYVGNGWSRWECA